MASVTNQPLFGRRVQLFNKPGDEGFEEPVVVHPETVGVVKGSVDIKSPDVFGSGMGVSLPLYDPE